ncbi:MAG: cytochrome C [Candidatus Krumholzibacteriia bacterium]
MRSRHRHIEDGCFRPRRIRLKAAVVTCWACCVVAVVLAPSARAQLSPGELAESHKELEGLKNCLKCHKLGKGPSADKCLACHKEIKLGMDAKRGFHHRVVTTERNGCVECHGEHAGRSFKMIHWPEGEENFNHAKTGLPLEGKHLSAKCRDCHRLDFIVDDPRALQEKIDIEGTYLGLRQACLSCHYDEHRKQLAEECVGCHDYAAWKPAPRFDHDKAKYRLTGKHKNVECRKCHVAIKRRSPTKPDDLWFNRYVGLKYDDCASCHKDVHKGRFKGSCKTCHTTGNWHKVAESRFDHTVTRFPLRGLHKKVKCDKCHAEGSKLRQRRFASCADCHRDAHRGQFAKRSHKGKCENCHNVHGFKPATFTVEKHNQGRFRLAGAHRAQPCIACHKEELDKQGKPFRRYIMKSRQCRACHDDVHAGQFLRNGPRKGCNSCHVSTEWNRIVFEHNRNSKFKLEGKHVNVSCSGCHKKVRVKRGLVVRYRPINHSCKTCHRVEGLKLQ